MREHNKVSDNQQQMPSQAGATDFNADFNANNYRGDWMNYDDDPKPGAKFALYPYWDYNLSGSFFKGPEFLTGNPGRQAVYGGFGAKYENIKTAEYISLGLRNFAFIGGEFSIPFGSSTLTRTGGTNQTTIHAELQQQQVLGPLDSGNFLKARYKEGFDFWFQQRGADESRPYLGGQFKADLLLADGVKNGSHVGVGAGIQADPHVLAAGIQAEMQKMFGDPEFSYFMMRAYAQAYYADTEQYTSTGAFDLDDRRRGGNFKIGGELTLGHHDERDWTPFSTMRVRLNFEFEKIPGGAWQPIVGTTIGINLFK